MKRTIEVSTRGTRLSLKDTRVQVIRENETLASIPIEDIGMVILESTGVSISSGVLKAIGEAGATVLACDDSHHPCGLFLPMAVNTLHSERVRMQAEITAPLKKNLWAKLVRAKIENQALALSDPDARQYLLAVAGQVRSGDESNREGKAARHYWSRLFQYIPGNIPPPFHRFREGPKPNNLLNYGYTVLRAATARALCMAGLHPAVGLYHRNRYSGFCLADDLMEPFRPFVDRVVLALAGSDQLEITKETKAALIGVLQNESRLNGESVPLAIALERSASSLSKAIEKQVKDKASTADAARQLLTPQIPVPCH